MTVDRPNVLTYADATADSVALRLAGRGLVPIGELDRAFSHWPVGRVRRAVMTLHQQQRIAVRWRAGQLVAVRLLEDHA